LRGQWQRRSVEESGEGARLAGEGAGRGFGRLLNVFALDLRGSRRLSRLEITAGATGCTETSESRGPVPIVPDARLVSGAVLGLGRFATESWTLVGGARLDLSHLEALHNPLLALASQSRRFHAWSGNAGAVYQAPGSPFALGVHLGHAWRVPTLLELYAHGPRPGAERYELGRRDLQPERGLGLQAGLSFRMSRARAELTVFRDRIHDWIELTATDESRDSLPIYRYRAQGAALVGGEATLDLEATRSLRLRGRLDHVSGQHLEPRGPLSSIPPTHWGLEAELHHASLPGGLSALVRGELEGCARQNRLGPLDAPADGYMLLHLGYEVRRAAAGGTIRLGLRLDNVANTRYRDFLSRDPVLGPGPGRSLVARISSGS
jgi:iron complex outermembrane receptor protein